MRVLLDTNAYSALMRGDEAVAERVRRSERLYLSTVVVGELLYGFRCGDRYESNRQQLDEFLASAYVDLLPVTLSTCERFAMVATYLRRKGRPIPGNDMWIAAHALEAGAELLSYNSHFSAIDNLSFTQLLTE